MRLDPETTLFIGLFCGLMIGYAIGTLMWFRRTPRKEAAPRDLSRYVCFSKTHVAAIKDQLTMGATNMTSARADALLTPDTP